MRRPRQDVRERIATTQDVHERIAEAALRPLPRLYTRERRYRNEIAIRLVLEAGWHEGDKVRKEILFSTTDWPEFFEMVQYARRVFRGEQPLPLWRAA